MISFFALIYIIGIGPPAHKWGELFSPLGTTLLFSFDNSVLFEHFDDIQHFRCMGLFHPCFVHDLSYGPEFGSGEGQVKEEFPLGDRQVDLPLLSVPTLSGPDDDIAEIGIVPCCREPGP